MKIVIQSVGKGYFKVYFEIMPTADEINQALFENKLKAINSARGLTKDWPFIILARKI